MDESRYFNVPDEEQGSVRVYTRIQGRGDNAVFFTHGLGADSFEFQLQVEALMDRYVCVAPDQRGFGHSPYTRHCSVEISADDTVCIADQLGVDDFNLVGHSLGGMVALVMALKYPERVKKLVIIDSSSAFWMSPLGWSVLRAIPEVEHYMTVPVKSIIATMFAKGIVFRPDLVGDRIKEYYFGPTSRLRHPDYFKTAMKYLPSIVDFDVMNRLHEIQCPTLIIHGALDFGIPIWAATEMARRIPNARLFVCPRNFHSPNIEDPEPVNKRLCGFLDDERVLKRQRRTTRAKARSEAK